MHKKLKIIFIFLLLIHIQQSKAQNTSNFNDRLLDFIIESAADKFIELPDLYEKYTEIPEQGKEIIILAVELDARGFKMIDSGRGNHMQGPRFIMNKFKKSDCECEVNKIYYSINSGEKYKVTERIKCKKNIR